MLPVADINFGELLLLVFGIALFVIWVWILFAIISDLFRDHDLSGGWKAVWIICLVFIPFLTMLVYLIVRGHGMHERALTAQAEAKHELDSYIRQEAHTTPADELHKLHDLKQKGALTDDEFERAKAKLLG